MVARSDNKVAYGDFQTPPKLCEQVCGLLNNLDISPASIVEPTCGQGFFLQASRNAFPSCERILGFEINSDYVETARDIDRVTVHQENFFEKDWRATFDTIEEPILLIGNPPWVTNTALSTLGAQNLPQKTNIHKLNGFSAITGKSNFDISEWMLLHLLECLSGRKSTIAMLCKTVVARKVLQYAWRNRLQLKSSAMYSINALEHFGAAVDACLLVCDLEPASNNQQCDVYRKLEARTPDSAIAYRHGRLISNLTSFERREHLYGKSHVKWRSGIKNDCARVMELTRLGSNTFENGIGETLNLEPTYLYPMLKSASLMKTNPSTSRYMLVTQEYIGEDTSQIQTNAPKTWNYLEKYARELNNRASSIYRNRPQFSIFGVGSYTFAPWKVAISGFYKRFLFRVVGPLYGKPVVFDDTCYFLPCESEDEAKLIAEMMNSELAQEFMKSLVFWDAKRPITAELLRSLNLHALSAELGIPMCGGSDGSRELPFWKG